MESSQLVNMFGKHAKDPEIIDKCSHICSLFNLTAQELFSNWEAFTFTEYNDTNLKLSLNHLDGLQSYLQDRLTQQNKISSSDSLKLNKHQNNNKSNNNISFNSTTYLDANDTFNISSVKKRKLNSTKNITSSPIKENINSSFQSIPSNQIIESFNSDLIQNKETTIINKNIKIIANFNPKKYKFRTMNLKLLEIADYLDEKIDNITQIISDNYNINENQFSDPTRQSQSEIYTVGRIVPDSPLSNSFDLNLDSLFLETSRSMGFGYRIKLDVSQLNKISFFSGQIVAFRGINQSGNSFKALENLKIPYLGSISYNFNEIENFSNIIGNDNLKIIILSGPYHSKNSLNFSYLENFINHLNKNIKPDVIIMLGPFINSNSIENILNNNNNNFFNSDDNLDDLKNLDDLFISFLSPILNKLNCQRIILLPHQNDISNPHTNYPQSPFNRKLLGLNKNFKCFPNPSLFNINELSFGISTADILKDLKDIITKNANSNRIERIIEHIIQQRQFYPIIPSPNSFQLDTSYLGLSEFNDEIPDIMILPSILKSFTKVIKNVLVINPGCFLRPDGSNGSYSLIQVKSPNIDDMDKIPSVHDDDDEEISEVYLATAWKRVRVDTFSV